MAGKVWTNKKKIILRILCVTVFFLVLFCTVWYQKKKEKEKRGRFVATLEQDCYFFPAGAEETFPGGTGVYEENYVLVFGKAGTKLYYKEEAGYYLEDSKKAVTVSLPIYQKNGATLYLSEKVPSHRFFCTDASLARSAADVFVSCGMVFDREAKRVLFEEVFLLECAEFYFVSNPLVFEGYDTQTIRANSLLYLEEDAVTAYGFYDGLLKKQTLPVSEDAMFTMGENRVSYHDFYAYYQSAKTTDTPVLLKGGRELSGDYYYFFLDQRYELHGPCVLYDTKEGLYLEAEGVSYTLTSAPLYAVEEDRLYLPADYMLLRYNQRLYSRVETMTELRTEDMETMYLLQGDTLMAQEEFLLHDGSEHYLVLAEATLSLGETKVTLSPMSSIYVPDGFNVSYYDYDSKSYVTCNTKGKQATLRLKNDAVVYLYDRMIEYSDGNVELFLNDPTLLPVAQ